MRSLNNPILIFSVERFELSEELNYSNTLVTEVKLNLAKIPFIKVIGSYQNHEETSFLILKDLTSLAFVVNQCEIYNQECFLDSDSNRDTKLRYRDGHSEYIGSLIEVSKEEAIEVGYYTKVSDSSYWITRKS